MASELRTIGALVMSACLAGCTTPVGDEATTAGRSTPSEFAFHSAMESAFADEIGVGTGALARCRPVRRLQCLATDGGQRAECTYGYEGQWDGTAILEREPHGFWRWIRGPKNCSARRPGSGD